MNKKIFTLLMGAALSFVLAFSAFAQISPVSSPIDGQTLRLGDPVSGISLGTPTGFFHLRVDSIVDGSGTGYGRATTNWDSGVVLFMYDSVAINSKLLYIDTINTTAGHLTNPYNPGAELNTTRSAASLWCVSVGKYDQGKPIIFDFVNKLYEDMIDVDIDTDSVTALGRDTAYIPGSINGWHFATTSTPALDQVPRPLYSYIGDADKVATLVLNETVTATTLTTTTHTYTVEVKIVRVSEVLAGTVPGLLYFTLVEPMPFTLSPNDINTKLGFDLTNANPVSLVFGETAANNPFVTPGVIANSVSAAFGSSAGLVYRDDASYGLAAAEVTAGYLDSLGYVTLQAGTTSSYIYVDTSYHVDKINAGDRFPTIKANGGLPNTGITTYADSIMLPQYAFRFVYDPQNDNVLLNVYKATYWPEDYTSPNGNGLPFYRTDSTEHWADSLTQKWYTFVADDSTFLQPVGATWNDSVSAPLKSEVYPIGANSLARPEPTGTGYIDLPYRYAQKLYIGVQKLTANPILTLDRDPKTIDFGVYAECSDKQGTKRTTVDTWVYLIRSAPDANGVQYYLHVPLYSANDSAIWHELEDYENPVLLPSYHWLVEKKYPSSKTSVIIIRNREFPWLKYEGIQLENGDFVPFKFKSASAQNPTWNYLPIDPSVTKHSADNGTSTFIAIDEDDYLNDPHLGYTYVSPDETVDQVHAFRYWSGISSEYYLRWHGELDKYPATDTTAYVDANSYFTKLYFRLDTIKEPGYGDEQEYGYIVENTVFDGIITTLKRQAYRLTFEDPLKYQCYNTMALTNADNRSYAVAQTGAYKDYLGKPVFYLRHMYDNDGTISFALVQRIDTTSLNPNNAYGNNNLQNLQDYLAQEYNSVFAQTVIANLISGLPNANFTNDSARFNPGLFVASFEEHTGILRYEVRSDVQNSVTTFSLEADPDPIYRRFNTAKEGPGYDVVTGTYTAGTETTDMPKVVSFYRIDNTQTEYLFENTGGTDKSGSPLNNNWNYWKNYGERNYLGLINTAVYPNTNTAIYVDTAYVNRGNGPIKPQYLLMVDPQPFGGEEGAVCYDKYGTTYTGVSLEPYLRGRYLINAYDSAHATALGVSAYLWNTAWERLVFVDAIHARDHLYILGGDLSDITYTTASGASAIDLDKLDAAAAAPGTKIHKIFLGDNSHKDCVFSFRLIERRADDFIIESETQKRGPVPEIKPCFGGWVKTQNGVPIISRSDEKDAMAEADRFNVKPAGEMKPVATDPIEVAELTVVGGEGAVTILNAAGKSVTIANVLGQTVATTVLTSDNQTVAAPKGIVIVNVGGTAVKAIVK